MLAHGHQFPVSVQFPCRSSRHSHAEEQGLLDNQHQHTRKNGIAVTARRVEDGHFVEVERLGGDLIVAVGETARLRHLDVGIDMACHRLCRLVDRLVGEHQTHVCIYSHMSLFATLELGVEVLWKIEDAMHRLLFHQFLRLVHACAEIGGLGVGSRIEISDELPGGMTVREIHDGGGHFPHHLVVVDPGVEKRIAQWHEDAEHEHAFVTNHIAHLVSPDEAHVLDTSYNLI